MDKCREEFEEWINSETGLLLHRTNFPMTKHEDQQYYDHKTNLAWFSWKASRESMKAIKLPKHSNPLKDKTMMFISDVRILLESAGINVEIDE